MRFLFLTQLLGQRGRDAAAQFRRDGGQSEAVSRQRIAPARVARQRVEAEYFTLTRRQNRVVVQDDVDKASAFQVHRPDLHTAVAPQRDDGAFDADEYQVGGLHKCVWMAKRITPRRVFQDFEDRLISNDAKRRSLEYGHCMNANLPIEVDPEIMSGAPVFRGTRVPVRSLFDYLEDNLSLGEFLECFPTVRREDAIAVLEHSKSGLLQEVHA
jgi:uncharacterized protein (DUF433 family)